MKASINLTLNKHLPGISQPIPIASGSYGTVFYTFYEPTKTYLAIKVIEKSRIKTEKQKIHLDKEVKLLKRIDHPFCIHFFDYFQDDSHYYLVQEYASEGSLYNYLKRVGRVEEELAKKIFCQIISALRYLHEEMLIIHRDLKLENILFDPFHNIKLIDFGLSTYETHDENLFQTFCGSLNYMAPEMFLKQKYTNAVDMWSLGVIIYALTVGQLPYAASNPAKLKQAVLTTQPQYPPFLSPLLIDLLQKLLEKDPKKRLTAPQAIYHPWLENSKYASYCKDAFLMDPVFKILPATIDSVPPQIKNDTTHKYNFECISRIVKTAELTSYLSRLVVTMPRSVSTSIAPNQLANQYMALINNGSKRATISGLNVMDHAMVGTRRKTLIRSRMSKPNTTFSEHIIIVPE